MKTSMKITFFKMTLVWGENGVHKMFSLRLHFDVYLFAHLFSIPDFTGDLKSSDEGDKLKLAINKLEMWYEICSSELKPAHKCQKFYLAVGAKVEVRSNYGLSKVVVLVVSLMGENRDVWKRSGVNLVHTVSLLLARIY